MICVECSWELGLGSDVKCSDAFSVDTLQLKCILFKVLAPLRSASECNACAIKIHLPTQLRKTSLLKDFIKPLARPFMSCFAGKILPYWVKYAEIECITFNTWKTSRIAGWVNTKYNGNFHFIFGISISSYNLSWKCWIIIKLHFE